MVIQINTTKNTIQKNIPRWNKMKQYTKNNIKLAFFKKIKINEYVVIQSITGLYRANIWSRGGLSLVNTW